MFTGKLYDKTIKAKTYSQLKQTASRIANGKAHPIDEMLVTTPDGHVFKLTRINKVTPWGEITRGAWGV